MDTVIYVNALKKQFKKVNKKGFFRDLFRPEFIIVDAVDNISFGIKKGESVAFLGPNGAGKTTTIKMLTGIVYPTSGIVKVLGFSPFERKTEFLKRIGLVMGNKAGLNWDLTPKQSFSLLKNIYQIPNNIFEKRVEELTQILDISKFLNTQVRKLSLGERMKMEIIGAILHNPEVLFLDEPTIGLDIIAKQSIRDFLREVQKNFNVTILLTSHDMDDVEKVCDRVIVINKGKKIYDNKLAVLTNKYNQFKYIKFYLSNDLKKEDLNDFLEYEITEKNMKYLTIKVSKELMPKLIANFTSKINVVDIDIVSTPLEEIIKDLFNK